MSFKDHFSGHAASYARGRPNYPASLFAWLASQCDEHAIAWDAGCGSGQASVALAERFARVIATDPSAAQIANATPHPRVTYRVEAAEQSAALDASVDLVTVAQALHWFDADAFYREVRRVLKPRGVIAVWSYALMRITPAIDRLIMHLHDDVLGSHWPPERRHVIHGYAEIPFPFELLPAPRFVMQHEWPLADVLAYLETWSALPRYRRSVGRDALAEITPALAAAWGDGAASRQVAWPLTLSAGRV